ncbi:hypothetical protein [Thiomonas sp. FB-Cd]|uniref:hypothetical protein n=1 Tax=Thiomonas sp. FB-Cd TaxID=1158292 RepID=UPI000AA10342|nr:hypothetical protein [Thiomonas sp. FB-Cd]
MTAQQDGQWRFSEPLRVKGRFVRLQPKAATLDQSPSLILRGAIDSARIIREL